MESSFLLRVVVGSTQHSDWLIETKYPACATSPPPFLVFKLLWVEVRITLFLSGADRNLITLRLENEGTFLGRQSPWGSTSVPEGQVHCLPTWVAGVQQPTITSEPEFPTVRPGLIPTDATWRSQERQQPHSVAWRGANSLTKALTREAMKLTPLWGKETKKSKMKLYVSKGLSL